MSEGVVDTRMVKRELTVLREAVKGLQTLAKETHSVATFTPNPQKQMLTAFSLKGVPINELTGFLDLLHDQLEREGVGAILDAIVLKPMAYRRNERIDESSLNRAMFVNFYFSPWIRENIMGRAVLAAPSEKFYNVNLLPEILDTLDAELELLVYEQSCVDRADKSGYERDLLQKGHVCNSGAVQVSITQPSSMVSLEKALKVLEECGFGEMAKKLLPILQFKKEGKNAKS
jgi:hypothetical protein